MTAQRPRWVLVLSGDHVYRMDYRGLLEWHAEHGAAVTVGCVEVPLREASAFGIVRTDGDRVVELCEKPRWPRPSPGRAGVALASMGVYVFDAEHLRACLNDEPPGASTDFARDVLPRCLVGGGVSAFSLAGTPWPYWRDVGTVEAYWGAQMELLGAAPAFELTDPAWPVWSRPAAWAPPRFGASSQGEPPVVADSIVGPGCTVAAAVVRRSVVGPDATIAPAAVVEESVLLPGSSIGAGSRVRRAVIDEGCPVPPGSVIDAADPAVRASGAHVTPGGIVLLTARDAERLTASRQHLRAHGATGT